MDYKRRDIMERAAAAFPAASLLGNEPNSNLAGVQVGISAPHSFRKMPGGADDILNYLAQANINPAELRTQPLDGFLGALAVPAVARAGRTQLTP